MLGASWIVGEWLRSCVFTGYAWALLSLLLVGPFDRPGAAAALPLAGTYAFLGIIVALSALTLAALLARRWVSGGASIAAIVAAMLPPALPSKPGTLPFTL